MRNEILKSASVFAKELDQTDRSEPHIDEHRDRFGVEPICQNLGVSASAFYQRATGERSRRVVKDDQLLATIHELHQANNFAYGSRRMCKALTRAGENVGRGRVERLMRTHGIRAPSAAGRRGRPPDPTPRPGADVARPPLRQ